MDPPPPAPEAYGGYGGPMRSYGRMYGGLDYDDVSIWTLVSHSINFCRLVLNFDLHDRIAFILLTLLPWKGISLFHLDFFFGWSWISILPCPARRMVNNWTFFLSLSAVFCLDNNLVGEICSPSLTDLRAKHDNATWCFLCEWKNTLMFTASSYRFSAMISTKGDSFYPFHIYHSQKTTINHPVHCTSFLSFFFSSLFHIDIITLTLWPACFLLVLNWIDENSDDNLYVWDFFWFWQWGYGVGGGRPSRADMRYRPY